MSIIPECYKCHRTNVVLASIYAAGQYWMCDDCIRTYENETKTIAVFFNLGGLKFLSREEYDALEKPEKEKK